MVIPIDTSNSSTLDFFTERSKRKRPKRQRRVKGAVEVTPKLAKPIRRGNIYSHTKTGFRKDLSITVRSGWEANVLRILASFDIPFEFEPRVFYYPVKRGHRAYCPDIYLNRTQEYIEVKGYLDAGSRTKLNRFRIYYPEEFANLTMIISKSNKAAIEFCKKLQIPRVLFYEELVHLFRAEISTWEG